LAIAEGENFAPWEREALALAALWHDIGRDQDDVDYYHGAKSAGKVVGLGLHRGVDSQLREIALFVVTHHSGSETHAESAASHVFDPSAALRVFRILKDADGLDRVRLGDLDPRYLRLEVSRHRVKYAHELLAALPR
jgi:exopolyphosphatase/pppGpp-phosphohydrolase